MTLEEAKIHAEKYGWSQKLGFTKVELGIKTPRRLPKNWKRNKLGKRKI